MSRRVNNPRKWVALRSFTISKIQSLFSMQSNNGGKTYVTHITHAFTQNYSKFKATAANQVSAALFWAVTQREVVVYFNILGQPTGPICRDQENDGTDRLSRNVGEKLSLLSV
jgi:hypothetical protein